MADEQKQIPETFDLGILFPGRTTQTLLRTDGQAFWQHRGDTGWQPITEFPSEAVQEGAISVKMLLDLYQFALDRHKEMEEEIRQLRRQLSAQSPQL